MVRALAVQRRVDRKDGVDGADVSSQVDQRSCNGGGRPRTRVTGAEGIEATRLVTPGYERQLKWPGRVVNVTREGRHASDSPWTKAADFMTGPRLPSDAESSSLCLQGMPPGGIGVEGLREVDVAQHAGSGR